MDETMRRLNLAEEIIWAYRRDLGEHMVASACYGSVAHGRADRRSNLELIVLTDTAIEAVNVHTVRNGVQVECDVLPTERLRRAAQVVTIEWGVEADCYRPPVRREVMMTTGMSQTPDNSREPQHHGRF